MVTVRVFGLLREEAGRSVWTLEAKTLAAVFLALEAHGLSRVKLRNAWVFVNQKPARGMMRLYKRLDDGDEVALLSPVSGG